MDELGIKLTKFDSGSITNWSGFSENQKISFGVVDMPKINFLWAEFRVRNKTDNFTVSNYKVNYQSRSEALEEFGVVMAEWLGKQYGK